MNVLITGGAGFIGSHLAERCLAEGWRVTILDDLSTGRADNYRHLKSRPDFLPARIESILDRPVVAEVVDQADYVFHLAAAVGVKQIIDRPLESMETNVIGTKIVFECAARRRTPVLFTSTSEVYGKCPSLPFREDADPVFGPATVPRWSYAVSKFQDEQLAMLYWRQKGLPATVVRLFNTVGPRQTGEYGMVVPTFVKRALAGEPLIIHGDGNQTRCFSYVADVVESLVRLAQTPEAVGQVINVGSNNEVSINELAAMVKEITGSPSRLEHQPHSAVYGEDFEDMERRVPSVEKLENLIGYRPTTSLDAIVRRVVDYEWVRQIPQKHLVVTV